MEMNEKVKKPVSKFKKIITTVIAVLAILVIAFIAIILFDPFSGVKVKGEVADEADRYKLSDIINDYLNERQYSYKFTYQEKYEESDEDTFEARSSKISGTVSKNDFYYSYEYSGKETVKTVTSTTAGKKTDKKVTEEDVTVVSNSLKMDFYVDQKITYAQDNSKYISELKTRRNEIKLGYEILSNYLYFSSSDLVYVDDDVYTIIKNKVASFTEITIKLDGRNIEKVTYEYKDSEGYEKVTFKMINYKEIKAPRNADKYGPAE